MTASLFERVNIHAGAKVDDLHAILVALDDAGDQVRAVDRGDDEHIIVHVGHGHEYIELRGGVALGRTGLYIHGDAKLLAGLLVTILHVCPESVGQRDDHCADLDVAVILGHRTELFFHRSVELVVELLHGRREFSLGHLRIIRLGRVVCGRIILCAAGSQCQHHCKCQQKRQ